MGQSSVSSIQPLSIGGPETTPLAAPSPTTTAVRLLRWPSTQGQSCRRNHVIKHGRAPLRIAGRNPLMTVGDFNAARLMWGYRKENPPCRKLVGLISTLGMTLLANPVHPTRVGNSVTQDTCPDFTLTKHIRHADWMSACRNTEDTLACDHCILKTAVYTRLRHRSLAQLKLPDWNAFR
ncbi:hypothetical protein HPB49_018662 [Dermacentor silvarum]|uniref:Uncharacterized protein n=1 Tax=Dermacentor silvarum TaxID=543639 RepID=A0ACB8D789_DERSI|nr:hypothetical protein HPB49_018662 [Dermacentor silvarum]